MKYLFLLLFTGVMIAGAQAQSVGIGTAAPNTSAQLEVASTTKGMLIPRMTATQRAAIASPVAGLMVYETTSSSFWFYNGSSWVQQAAGGASPWITSGSNIYNTNSGAVGIGGSPAASAALDIKSITKGFLMPVMTSIERVSIANPAEGLMVYDENAKKTYQYQEGVWRQLITNDYWTHSVSRNVVYNSTDSIGIGTSVPTERFQISNGNMRVNGDIYNTGSMGVGVTNPIYKLDVDGTTRIAGNVYVEDGLLRMRNTADSKIWDMTYSSSTNRLMLMENGQERVMYANGGNVGIAPTLPAITPGFPSTKLHIETGQDAGLNATSNGYLMLGPASGNNVIIDNNEIIARTGTAAGSLVLQNDGGSVRIGSVAVPAGYKFGINGKMICEEVKVKLASTGWPDYVFADSYDLKPLQEVEEFITRNKHLPNIPSAAEVEKNGLAVGDMQKRMMEKIEELTLYIIQLQKEVNDLKDPAKK